MITRLAIPFSLLTLVVIGVARSNPVNTQAIKTYHEHIAELIEEIPVDVNGWVGHEVPLPQSATSLLNPNGIVARQYINEERGVIATLMIVQCKDARDMGGHYPPVCYPANGWTNTNDSENQVFSLGDQSLRVYGFSRTAGRIEREITIYSLFALPTGELTNQMSDVRRLSANYDYRKFGAAQLQILINGEVDTQDHPWILKEMYEIARPAMEAVLDAQLGNEQDDGGQL